MPAGGHGDPVKHSGLASRSAGLWVVRAVFCLVAALRGVSLRTVPAGADKGNTPDFLTINEPAIGFEVKTIDITDPEQLTTRTWRKGSMPSSKWNHLLGGPALVGRCVSFNPMVMRKAGAKPLSR